MMAGPLYAQGTRNINFAPPRVPNFSSPRSTNGHLQRVQPGLSLQPASYLSVPTVEVPMSPPPAMGGCRPIYMPDDYAMKLEEWRNGGYEHYKMKLDQIGKKEEDDHSEGVLAAELQEEDLVFGPLDSEPSPPLAGEHKKDKSHKEHKHSRKHSHSHSQVQKVELLAHKPKPATQKSHGDLFTFLRPKAKTSTKEHKRHHKKGSKDEKRPIVTPPESDAEPEPASPAPAIEAPKDEKGHASSSGLPKLVKKVSFLLEKKHTKKPKKKEKVVLVAAKKEHGKKQTKDKAKGKGKGKGKGKAQAGKATEPDGPAEPETQEELGEEDHGTMDMHDAEPDGIAEATHHEDDAPVEEPPHLEAEAEAAAPADEAPGPPTAEKAEEQIIDEHLEAGDANAAPVAEEVTPPASNETPEPAEQPGDAAPSDEAPASTEKDDTPAVEHETPSENEPTLPASEPAVEVPQDVSAEEGTKATEEGHAEAPPAKDDTGEEKVEPKPKRSAPKRKGAKTEPRKSAISQELFGSDVESELDLHSVDGVQWVGELQDAPPPPH